MSVLQHPDGISPLELQVWNNAAFDNGESEDSIKSSWWNQSLESSCSKENLNPSLQKSPISIKSPLSNLSSIKPLNPNTTIVNSVSNPVRAIKKVIQEEEDGKIDQEIEEIEKEITRLSSRLEALRLEKAEKTLKQRGRVVQAKFMEAKESVKIEEPLVSSAKTKMNRRGVSMGPSEIYSATKPRLWGRPEVTPISTQNRRKSCFWKLEEIDELKATKQRGKSSSVSPRSRKTLPKIQLPKMAATTVGSKRPVKKEEGFLTLIQPKTLFKDGEKSVPNKKQLKPGRVVASRYNQTNRNSSEMRKRSLPDSDKEDGNKRRASREDGVSQRTEGSRVKKKWGIPSEIVVYKSDESVEEYLNSAPLMVDVPKIKTFRCVNDTPRDSGAAKRVADLVGKKSYFSIDEEEMEEDSVCQALCFGEDDDL
ncbi:hypothetical protein M5689_012173 [Euphorbia peplus]|nr:hypothetical protein M5689_012173 [Euphorbia peplus]